MDLRSSPPTSVVKQVKEHKEHDGWVYHQGLCLVVSQSRAGGSISSVHTILWLPLAGRIVKQGLLLYPPVEYNVIVGVQGDQ